LASHATPAITPSTSIKPNAIFSKPPVGEVCTTASADHAELDIQYKMEMNSNLNFIRIGSLVIGCLIAIN
jgi:hypothetical protein